MDVVSGTLALIGDSAFGEESGHHRHLFDPGCTVHLLPTAMAYEDPAGAIAGASEHLAKLDNEVRVLDVMKRADSSDAALAEQVRDARAIYVIGGSPMHLRSVLKDTPLLDALVGAWSHGATVAVAAESCSVLCSHMVDHRGGAFTVGLGLITTLTVIPRFDRWSPDKRSRTISLAPPELVVVGIDEGTALVRAPDGSWGVTGSGEVHVFAEGRRVDLDGLPRTLNPDAGF
jgi:cyanophycinase